MIDLSQTKIVLSRQRKPLPFDTSTPAQRAAMVGHYFLAKQGGEVKPFIIQHAARCRGIWFLQYGEVEEGVPDDN